MFKMDDEKTEKHAGEHHVTIHQPHDRKNKWIKFENLFIGLCVLLGLVIILNLILTLNVNQSIKKNIADLNEKLRPGKIELSIIGNSKCTDCSDIEPIMEYVKSLKVNITSEKKYEFDSKEGKELVSKYRIERVPALVVTGEIEKVSIEGLEKRENAMVFDDAAPPYTNTKNGNVFGRVRLSLLQDPSCKNCSDLSILINQLKFAGITISEQKNLSSSSDEGKTMISKYKIDFLPTIILSSDASAYQLIQQAWPQVGTKENDAYILRAVYPPFINLTTGQLRGFVDVIYLIDKSCNECYNISIHKTILSSPQSFAITLNKEETVDISDAKGKELILKYNITRVPTVVLTKEVNVYPSSQSLKQFYSSEKDGTFVFRHPSLIGSYKDLSTGKIIKPQRQQ